MHKNIQDSILDQQ